MIFFHKFYVHETLKNSDFYSLWSLGVSGVRRFEKGPVVSQVQRWAMIRCVSIHDQDHAKLNESPWEIYYDYTGEEINKCDA